MSNTAENAPAAVGSTDVGSRVEAAKDQTREKLDDLKHKAEEGYKKASVKVKDAYEKASAKVQDTAEKATEVTLKDVQTSMNSYVRENPGKSVLIATGAGLLIGLLLRGRH